MTNTPKNDNTVCFHCGLESNTKQNLPTLNVFNKTHYFCCMGCYSVCQMIVESGHHEYYRYRLLDKSKPAEIPDFLSQYQIYDQDNIQKSFVVKGNNWKEAYLLLENIRCPACVWLNEKHLRAQKGVLEVYIDASTNRARIKWQPNDISLSQILQSIANIGYLAHPYDAKHSRRLEKTKKRRNLEKLLFAGVIGMMLMQFSIATYLVDNVNAQGELLDWVKWGRWGALFGALGLLIYPAQDFWIGVWQDLKRKRIGMDVPIVLGLSAAFLASLHSVINNQGEVYFDSIAMFVFFILLARFLEFKARKKSISRLDQLNIKIAQTCEKWHKNSQTWKEVAVIDLKIQDLIRIKPGEALVADGNIVVGESSFDESLLTGEAHLVQKSIGDKVIAGSVNHDQRVEVSITQVGSQTLLSQIGQISARALESKPALASSVERVASWFVIGVLVVALCTASYWIFQGDKAWLSYTISVLIVTCPCALALATPVALTLGVELFIKQGILPLKMSVLEVLASVNQVVFDKTGTLTDAHLSVSKVELIGDTNKQESIKLALSLAAHSEHVVAKSLINSFDMPSLYPVLQFKNSPGSGIEADINGVHWHFGRLNQTQALSQKYTQTVSALSNSKGVQAIFVFDNDIRCEAKNTIEQLAQMHIQDISILSGDNTTSVQKVAQILGIKKYFSNCKPSDKLAWLQNQQRKGSCILFVGDGINDAPTLAGANVSLSLSAASDMANIHSDFIGLSNRLDVVPKAIKSSKLVVRIVRQNLFWALSYNIIAVPLAALGFVPPWLAAIGMSLSSLLVVLNALRLQKL